MNGIEYQLGQINAKLENINQRLTDGSMRHADLDDDIAAVRARVDRLDLIEAKRGGVLAAIAAFGSLAGGLAALAIQYALKKL